MVRVKFGRKGARYGTLAAISLVLFISLAVVLLLPKGTPLRVEKYDIVEIHYTVWESNLLKAYVPLDPLFNATIGVHVVPITEDHEKGLILGLYNNLIGVTLYYESGPIWLRKCVDQDRDGVDDNSGKPALSYGNSSDQYFNMYLMIQFKVLAIQDAHESYALE